MLSTLVCQNREDQGDLIQHGFYLVFSNSPSVVSRRLELYLFSNDSAEHQTCDSAAMPTSKADGRLESF